MARADTKYPGFKTGNLKWYPDDMIIAPPTAGKYIFVDGNVGTAGSGTSWADAFKTIQAAVDDAGNGGDVIMVAPKDSDGFYNENVVIGGTTALEYGLVGLHVMGVMNGLKNVRVKAVGASDLQAYSSLSGVSMLGSCFTIMCSSIEISNMCLDASGVYTGIHRTDGNRLVTGAKTGQTDSQNSSTHDCVFKYGTTGLNFDGASNDHVVYNNIFYKQTDDGVYIGPGGLQQTVRVYVYNNIFNGPEDYGVYIYSTTNAKDHIIGPGNVFKDQLSGTTEMTPVYSLADTSTTAVVGNFMAVATDHDLGTLDIGSGNFVGTVGATEDHVAIA